MVWKAAENKKCKTCSGVFERTRYFHSNGVVVRGGKKYRTYGSNCINCISSKNIGKIRKNPSKRRSSEKDWASSLIKYAIKKGRIQPKPFICKECGLAVSSFHMHAYHHRGYSDPLVFKWMCRWCIGEKIRKKARKK